jgi:uncharacterized protein YecT (DUF1311 family)
MLFVPLILAAMEVPDNSGYFYIPSDCVAQNDGTDPIFWGLVKGECEEVAEADQRLNSAYKRVMLRLPSARKIQLRSEQRRWIKSTNRVCDLLLGGTVSRPDSADCFIREATKRTAELLKWVLPVSNSASAVQPMPSTTASAKPAKLEGLPYPQARAIILRYGWKPLKGECTGAGANDRICSRYPEIGNCTGNGIGFCDMSFYRKDRCLIVVAIGGAPTESGSGDSKVRDVTFIRRPCVRA